MLRLGGYSGKKGLVRESESEGIVLMRLKNELEGISWNHGPHDRDREDFLFRLGKVFRQMPLFIIPLTDA